MKISKEGEVVSIKLVLNKYSINVSIKQVQELNTNDETINFRSKYLLH